MEIKELLISKLRDHLRIPAGLVGIRGIREQGVQNHPVQHALRGGEGALHLIVHYPVISQRPFRGFQPITPAFLAEDLLMLIDIGIEHRVHVDVHQVLEILVVAACHRINRLIRVGHGIEKCIQRALHQLHEGILGRKVPGSAQHGMFHDVGHAGAVCRGRTESDAEYFIVILILHQKHPGPALFVAQKRSFGLNAG